MNHQEFMITVEEGHLRSKRVLDRKGQEYATEGGDRLEQFHRAACVQCCSPTEALIGMATKHYTSISDMSKDPVAYSLKKWREKLVDLRNYTHLLEALLIDLGVE